MHKIIISFIILSFTFNTSLCFAEKIKKEDKNKDGKPDVWIFYGKKYQKRIETDLNFDGKADMYAHYLREKLVKLEIDADYDGKVDMISDYKDGKVLKMQEADKNGKMRVIFDISGNDLLQQKHAQDYKANPEPLENSKVLPEKQKAQ